jgi:serine phosphatase RsbU (regulator of sigma subunit)
MADQGSEAVGINPALRLLREHPIFCHLSDELLNGLLRLSELVAFTTDEVLIRQDRPSDAAFLIIRGEVDVVVESNYGPVHLARLSSNSLLGELGVFADLPRSATVTARTDVEALRIGREQLLMVGQASPPVLFAIVNQLGHRLNTINRAVGFYTHALAALEHEDFDPAILADLMHPVPEMVNFAQTFRRMAEQIILRRTQREEMASAAAIQRSMLPPALDTADFGDRVDVFAKMRPARDVGGDFFDYFRLDDNRLAIVIADVCGKGVPASLFMAITRTVIRLVARDGADIASGLRRANELLSAENEASMFVTLFYAEFDMRDGSLTYCNCGHNPPQVIRADGSCQELEATGMPLAMLPDSTYDVGRTILAPGERVYLYTDGVTEACTADDVEFGLARLAATIEEFRSGSAEALVEGTFERVDAFAAGVPQSDDVTCLVLRFTPPDRNVL